METEKKIMLSGIQPSGDLHLGNYLGAIKNWADRVNDYECYYFMADLHTITVRQDPKELRRRSLEMLALYIACFTYPSLMAADILLYQPHFVPVGEDQKQHVELTRNLAIRFNNLYGETFRVPEPYIAKVGARIYGLSTPGQKMSKSIPDGCVFLMDEPNVIMKKFKRAVTDSDTEHCVRYDKENKPGVSNLIAIYSTVTGKTIPEIEKEFENDGYGVFKPAVGEAVVDMLAPIREEAKRLMADKAYLNGIYKAGAEKASYIAGKTLRKVYKKVGFYQL